MQSVTTAVATIIGSIALILFISFLLSWPTYMLWNGCLVGAVDGIRTVTWLQAWGLSCLFGLLFKSNITTKN